MTKNRFTKNGFTRRNFIRNTSFAAFGSPFIISLPGMQKNSASKKLVCRDVENHFKEIGTWVDWDKTVDTFKSGDPSKPVKKLAVTWKASFDAIREAVSRGADMLVSHESICVKGNEGPEVKSALPTEKPKFDFLEKTGLVVFRCHDTWDRIKDIGVRDTWVKNLNFNGKIVYDEYPFYVTEIAPTSVKEIARHIAMQIKPLGQNGVVTCGNLDKKITRIGTGTGAIVDPVGLRDTGAQLGVISDDYYVHVRIGVHMNELDFPVILVNHGVSEEWGIMNLAKHLKETFPSIEVFHIPQYCPYKIIS
jgi:putative NIF3 family GTP cyclohydrolase 1 type 2